MADADPSNLTGIWHGQYSYPSAKPPTPFVATILDQDGALTGGITERNTLPPNTGEPLAASLAGARAGSMVAFTKRYDETDPRYTTVAYEGTLNADFTEVEGSWNVKGWGGRFLMIRGATQGAPVHIAVEVKV
jgi:hypothetical protein